MRRRHNEAERHRWVAMCLALVVAGCAQISCIVEGTHISTPAGARPIEDIRPGDHVLSWSPAGVKEADLVVAKSTHRAGHHLAIRLTTGQCLRATPSHPVATPKGWVAAGALQVGDEVLVEHGRGRVMTVEVSYQPVTVFDLSVALNKTFFANGVLVHNKEEPLLLPPEQLAGNWIGHTGSRAEYCRLHLEPKGRGAFGKTEGKDVLAWRISRWTLDQEKGHLSIELRALPGRPKGAVRLEGKPYLDFMRLDILDDRGNTLAVVLLRKEKRLKQMGTNVRQAISELGPQR